MKRKLAAFVKRYFYSKAVVLLYHRIDLLDHDCWRLSVTPENFDQQLAMLKKKYTVVPLPQLFEKLNTHKLGKKFIAITFDDGYLDNYQQALPLLEKHQVPATIFIASGNVGSGKEFWWDDLERLVLQSPEVPALFSMDINGQLVEQSLEGEMVLTPALNELHQAWDANEEAPPTKRATLYHHLWKLIKPLPHNLQQKFLTQISSWVTKTTPVRPGYISVSEEQLLRMSNHPLVTIGAHTVSHPALSLHPVQYQQQELELNRKYLQQKLNKQVDILAYPYGDNNMDTVTAARNAGITTAFTTDEKLIYHYSSRFNLGRFEVKNWPASVLENHLKNWFQS